MKSLRILFLVMITLLFSSVVFSQTAKEGKTQDTTPIMASLSDIQFVSDDIVLFTVKVTQGEKTLQIIGIANCADKKVARITHTANGIVYKVMEKLSIPEKDSVAETAMLTACKQKPQIEIN